MSSRKSKVGWMNTPSSCSRTSRVKQVALSLTLGYTLDLIQWEVQVERRLLQELRLQFGRYPRRSLKGEGILKPLVNFVDGQLSFLSPAEPVRVRSPHRNRKSRMELQQLDEKELLMELVKDISNDLDLTSLCHKILQNVSLLVNGDRCSLFLVRGPKEGPRYLVSKVFDVNAESKLDDIKDLAEIRIPWGTGIVGYSAETGETVNIADAYEVRSICWSVYALCISCECPANKMAQQKTTVHFTCNVHKRLSPVTCGRNVQTINRLKKSQNRAHSLADQFTRIRLRQDLFILYLWSTSRDTI